jgi:hypothetical protein
MRECTGRQFPKSQKTQAEISLTAGAVERTSRMQYVVSASHAVSAIPPATITLAVTFLSIFFGSLAAGLAGFAFSAIAGAMLFHRLEPIEAVPLLLACSITTQLLSITRLWGTMQWRLCIPYLNRRHCWHSCRRKLAGRIQPSHLRRRFRNFPELLQRLHASAAAFRI